MTFTSESNDVVSMTTVTTRSGGDRVEEGGFVTIRGGTAEGAYNVMVVDDAAQIGTIAVRETLV